MKLKLNTGSISQGTPSASSPPPNPTPTSIDGKLKLSLGGTSATSPPATGASSAQPKPKRAGGGKKRPREDDDAASRSAPVKKRASGGTINFAKALQNKQGDTVSNPDSPRTPVSAIPIFKLNTSRKGKPPPRPLGVGYDSEAEDAEEDPTIEENVILRMAPGSDCDHLRDAIAQGRVGLSTKQGGADVFMRFYKNRRAAIFIRGRIYAAVLVDLPSITESMKSWDRRGWWKSADICQMILVISMVESEREVEQIPLPREVDQKTWQYPHGLTPPMYNVRKRRFRKRVSFKTIEAAEDEVERLLQLDEQTRQKGGTTEAQIVDLDRLQSQELSSAGEEEDAEGELDDNMYNVGPEAYEEEEEEEEEDPEALAARMAAELAGDDADIAAVKGVEASETAETASQLVAAQAAVDMAATPVGNGNMESDDDDDDDDEENDAEVDEEEDQEQAQLKAQQREEVADLQREIEKTSNDLSQASNPIIKMKFEKRLDSLRKELASKKRSLGEDPDE